MIGHDYMGPIGPSVTPGPIAPVGPTQAPCAQCQHAHPWSGHVQSGVVPSQVAPGTPSPAQPRGELPLP